MLRRVDWQKMKSHVKATLPEEACGLVGGVAETSKVVFEVENILHSPVQFKMDACGQVKAFLTMEKSGLELLAIYHSHPKGPDQPSETDLSECFYPGTPYLIWLPAGDDWICKAFLIQDGNFGAIPISLVDDE